MGVLEWIGAHFLGPFIALYKALQKPHPEIKIRALEPAGGGGGYVDFTLVVQNAGTKTAWASVEARVGATPVQAQPSTLDLTAGAPATRVRVIVPRPELGDLVKEFNDATTLHGELLTVQVADGKYRATATWREHVYTAEENSERLAIQQRRWRQAKGEEADADPQAP